MKGNQYENLETVKLRELEVKVDLEKVKIYLYCTNIINRNYNKNNR